MSPSTSSIRIPTNGYVAVSWFAGIVAEQIFVEGCRTICSVVLVLALLEGRFYSWDEIWMGGVGAEVALRVRELMSGDGFKNGR